MMHGGERHYFRRLAGIPLNPQSNDNTYSSFKVL